jgi:hypothetical protein
MAEGLAVGLAIVDGLREVPSLRDYRLLPSTRADLLRRHGRFADAREEYARALSLTANRAEQAFLSRRTAECERALRAVDVEGARRLTGLSVRSRPWRRTASGSFFVGVLNDAWKHAPSFARSCTDSGNVSGSAGRSSCPFAPTASFACPAAPGLSTTFETPSCAALRSVYLKPFVPSTQHGLPFLHVLPAGAVSCIRRPPESYRQSV